MPGPPRRLVRAPGLEPASACLALCQEGGAELALPVTVHLMRVSCGWCWGLILGLTSLGLPLPEGRSSPVVVPRQDKTTAGHSGESTEQIVRTPRDRRGPLSLWCRGGWRPPEPWLHEERMGWQDGAAVMVAVGIPSGADGGCAQHGGHVRGRSAEGRGGTWGSARCLLIHLTRHLSSKRRNRARGFLSQAPFLDYISQDAEGEN